MEHMKTFSWTEFLWRLLLQSRTSCLSEKSADMRKQLKIYSCLSRGHMCTPVFPDIHSEAAADYPPNVIYPVALCLYLIVIKYIYCWLKTLFNLLINMIWLLYKLFFISKYFIVPASGSYFLPRVAHQHLQIKQLERTSLA